MLRRCGLLLSSSSASSCFRSSRVLLGRLLTQNTPDPGEGIKEVQVIKWFVKEGAKVQAFDPLVEAQSDKATAQFSSPYDGVITKIHVPTGIAQVGDPLYDIDVDLPEDQAGASSSSSSASKPAAPKSTEKPAAAKSEEKTAKKEQKPKPDTDRKGGNVVLASPAVRRIAQEEKVDLAEVEGSGKLGRVLKEDVLKFVEGRRSGKVDTKQSTQQQQRDEPVVQTPGDRVVQITGIAKAMANSMEASLKIPAFGCMDEIRMNNLLALRARAKAAVEKSYKAQGKEAPSITVLSFIIKACSIALKAYPSVNATVNSDCTEVTHHGAHHISVAIDTPNGLVVPNIKNVQAKSVIQIAEDLQALAKLGRENKLTLDHIRGGTFSISNIGAIGGTYMRPVVFPPQVAIGAFGKTQVLPRFDDQGNVEKASIMQVSWSADHRVVDGATMVRFSNEVVRLLEDPESMVLHLA